MSAPLIIRGIIFLGTVVVGGIIAYRAYQNRNPPERPHENGPQPSNEPERRIRPRSPARNGSNRCTRCLGFTRNERNREFLKCGHVLHKDCFQTLVLGGETRCPECLSKISQSAIDEVLGNTENKNRCPICLDQINHRDIKILNCNHSFHEDCIIDMVENGGEKCPSCRKPMTDIEVEEIKHLREYQIRMRRSLMM